jgi:hypothetical protein
MLVGCFNCLFSFPGSMPGHLFTYFIENCLVILSTNSGSLWGVVVIRLEIETGANGKGDT